MKMYIELILLNLMAIIGSAGVVIWVGVYTETWWGLIATILLLVFANWVWWSIHFNNFRWF